MVLMSEIYNFLLKCSEKTALTMIMYQMMNMSVCENKKNVVLCNKWVLMSLKH